VLISFLRANRDIFAWKPAVIPGVARRLIERSLNDDPKATPKRQHLRHFADDRRDAIKKELAKLIAAGFIRNIFHPKWLANPILVRMKNTNEWRMCVDYTDLNKHCPRTLSGCRGLIKSSTPRRDATCSASSTAIPGTTRLPSRKKTRKRPRTSPRSVPTTTRRCRSG
jgi:hypothetical protein